MVSEVEFTYEEFTTRNIGFVSPGEQQRLRNAKVFVCGVGGMGGACVQSLIRTGIGHIAIADFDQFDVSNLNRQPFASLSNIGQSKTEVTKRAILDINPEIKIEVFGKDWVYKLDEILNKYKIVVNGMDDAKASVLLYRKSRDYQATVVDAYMSPLPSVTAVGPHDPRPEQRLGFPTCQLDWLEIDESQILDCVKKEVEYVMIHSSSARHILIEYAAEVVSGKRSRMSFAPMVLTTGNLMCFEVLNLILKRTQGADCRGYFFNPWQQNIERPRNFIAAWIMKGFVRRYLEKLIRAN